MDKAVYRIAAASSDGTVVDRHFGKAADFYIYLIDERGIVFLEKRKLVPVCEGGEHDDGRLRQNLKALADCDCLLVSRIGYGASHMARQMGLEIYELPGLIEKSAERMMQHIKVKALLEGRSMEAENG